MQRVHAVAVIAVEYDTVQPVSEGTVIDRFKKNLLARGYTVNDVHIHSLFVEDVNIEQAPHIRGRRLDS